MIWSIKNTAKSSFRKKFVDMTWLCPFKEVKKVGNNPLSSPQLPKNLTNYNLALEILSCSESHAMFDLR